jgi:hypothetical protein
VYTLLSHRSKNNMSTQQVDGNSVTYGSTNNNGGSVLNGGSTSVLDSVSLGYSDVGVFGSSVIEGVNAEKALSAGTFSYSNQRPTAKRLTEELAGGVSNTTLQSGAAQPGLVRSIHKLEVLRTRRLTTAIRAGEWNIYTGAWANDPTVAVDSLGTDDAATPTRAVPGELVYKTSAPTPVQDDYKAKTG